MPSETPDEKRRKRETTMTAQKKATTATLDWIFKDHDEMKLNLENEAKKAKIAYKESFQKMDLEKSYPALFEILWYTQLPCFDVESVTSEYEDQYGMLKGCFWKGTEMPCSKVFDMLPTDQGMCCTFNQEKAEKMFKEGKYRDMVEKLQKRDKSLSYDRNMNVPKSWEENTRLIPEAGISKGLKVILDAHSNLLAGGTVPGDFDGFYAIINAKDQYPMTSMKSILLSPGHNNFVSMSAMHITSKVDDIKHIKPAVRNCSFPDEIEMMYHNSYSQANCILECQLAYALSKVMYKHVC